MKDWGFWEWIIMVFFFTIILFVCGQFILAWFVINNPFPEIIP